MSTTVTTSTSEVSKIEAFLKSNLNKAGLVTWGVGILNAGLTEVIAHTFSLPAFLSFAAGGLVLVFLPDNTVVQNDVETFITDTVEAVVAHKVTSIPTVITDAGKLATDVESAITVKPAVVVTAEKVS